jgi:hypothetical protein
MSAILENVQQEQASLQDLQLVVDTLRANHGRYIDDHTGQQGTMRASAIALHTVYSTDGSVHKSTVVLLHEGNHHSYPYYCVNDMRLRAGQVHLTRNANGTVFRAAGRSIEDHVLGYNSQHDPKIYHAKITHVTRI